VGEVELLLPSHAALATNTDIQTTVDAIAVMALSDISNFHSVRLKRVFAATTH
jgi:hypothetical protein